VTHPIDPTDYPLDGTEDPELEAAQARMALNTEAEKTRLRNETAAGAANRVTKRIARGER